MEKHLAHRGGVFSVDTGFCVKGLGAVGVALSHLSPKSGETLGFEHAHWDV